MITAIKIDEKKYPECFSHDEIMQQCLYVKVNEDVLDILYM